MPLYEYTCESDGSVIELIRPMADADKPVDDPENKGRVFKRKLSTFTAVGAAPITGGGPAAGGCCPCGKTQGGCGAGRG